MLQALRYKDSWKKEELFCYIINSLGHQRNEKEKFNELFLSIQLLFKVRKNIKVDAPLPFKPSEIFVQNDIDNACGKT